MVWRHGWRAAVAGLAFLAAPTMAAAEPVTIRIGWVVVPAELTPILFAHAGIARHKGSSYELDPVRFSGGPLSLTALATGKIDVGGLGYATIANAIENAGLDDLRVIGDVAQDGIEGWSSNQYFVLKESPIRTVEDLKGKTVATPAIGGLLDVSMRAMLRKHGLDDRKDITDIEIAFPNMKASLAAKKTDLGGFVLPFSVDPGLLDIGRALFSQRDAIGPVQVSAMVARTGFLQKNRAAMIDFLEDNARAIRWYLDPANHDEAVRIVADFFKRPPEAFDWAFTHRDQYRDPNIMPNIEALQANIAMLRRFDLLKADLDIRPYVDLSLMREAIARVDAR